jgi:hypothetical protein
MATSTSSLYKSSLTPFQNELKHLTKEGFLSGYLVYGKNNTLHQASGFRILWENIRGNLGHTNRADANKIKKAASKLISGNYIEINNQKESAKLVLDLAKKTELITKLEQFPDAQPNSIEKSIEDAKLSIKDSLSSKEAKPPFKVVKIDLTNESESNGSRLKTLAKGAFAILGALGGIYAFSNALGLPAEIPEVTNTTTTQDAKKIFVNDVSWAYPAPKEFPPLVNISLPTFEEGPTVSQHESIEQKGKIAYRNSSLETFTENVFHPTPEEFSPISDYLSQLEKTPRSNSTLHLSNDKQESVSGDKQKLDVGLQIYNNIPVKENNFIQWNAFKESITTNSYALKFGLGAGLFALVSQFASKSCRSDYQNDLMENENRNKNPHYQNDLMKNENRNKNKDTSFYMHKGTLRLPDGGNYSGEIKNSLMHGKGIRKFPDGSSYAGEFQDNKMHGKGAFTFSNGDKYIGEFLDDSTHGLGTIIFSNGEKCVGDILRLPDGDNYIGEVKDGKMNGQGTIITTRGEEYSGKFKDGLIQGQANMKFSNGNIFFGEVIDGKMNGHGIITTPDGHKYVAEIIDGKMHDQITRITPNGDIYDGEVKDDDIVQYVPATKKDINTLKNLFPLDASRSNYQNDLMKSQIEEEKAKIINTIDRIKKNKKAILRQLAIDTISFMQYSKPGKKNSEVNLHICADVIQQLLDPKVIAKILNRTTVKFIILQNLLNDAFTIFIENYLSHQINTPLDKYDDLCLKIFEIYKDKFDAQITIETVNSLFFNRPNIIAQEITEKMSTFYLTLIDSKWRQGKLNAMDAIMHAIEEVAPTMENIPASKNFVEALINGIAQRYNDNPEYIKKCIHTFMKENYSIACQLISTKIPGFVDLINVPQETATPPFHSDIENSVSDEDEVEYVDLGSGGLLALTKDFEKAR